MPNLQRNFRRVQSYVGPTVTVCAVVKADAYGHGSVECARALQQEGARWFGVTSTEEGVRLRDAGIQGRILLMTGFWEGEENEVVARHLTPALWEPRHISLLRNAVRKRGVTSFPVHLKVDTGMARLGIEPENLGSLLSGLRLSANLALEGVFTHLASAEVLDAPDVEEQRRRFERVRCALTRVAMSPLYWHMANTAALISRPATWKDMVRAGISLYGYNLPFAQRGSDIVPVPQALPLDPVLSWKTRVISLRKIGSNQPVGYDGAYVSRGPAILAILPVGYGDGLARRLSSRGRAIVRNTFAPIVGNICMDLTLLDVTQVPAASIGDEVVLIGSSANCRITASECASCQSTIAHDVLCSIGKRVPRRYLGRPL